MKEKETFWVGNPWPALLMAAGSCRRARMMSWVSSLSATSDAEHLSMDAWHLEIHPGFGSMGSNALSGTVHFSAWLGVPLSWRNVCQTRIRGYRSLSFHLTTDNECTLKPDCIYWLLVWYPSLKQIFKQKDQLFSTPLFLNDGLKTRAFCAGLACCVLCFCTGFVPRLLEVFGQV